jgi:alkanesulfonate monooxygenase SsuD/methylene tetrahydromethanopterin reductase-like flavin-dependent oxidoreductase (luciferase family)
MPYDPDGIPQDGPVLECWTTLTAIAVHTSRVKVGTLVLSNTHRHPAVVANMAATLDQVSGGRVVLGVGAGWQVNEHAAYGIELRPPAARVRALDDACTVITSLLRDHRTTVVGDDYRITDAPCDPKPVQPRLPLLVGGGGEKLMLRLVARHADVWHAWTDPEALARKNAVLDGFCDELGRDPREIVRATGGEIAPGTSADAIAERLTALRAAGGEEFVVIDDANDGIDLALRQVDLISTDVLPRVA